MMKVPMVTTGRMIGVREKERAKRKNASWVALTDTRAI